MKTNSLRCEKCGSRNTVIISKKEAAEACKDPTIMCSKSGTIDLKSAAKAEPVISWIHGIWETGVFNSDQECQFTSSEFMTELRTHGILISMDGRGQCLDHTKMERFWWALK